MSEELLKDSKLLKEYENSFDGEEKLLNALKVNSSNYELKPGFVKFDELSFQEPKKNSRNDTCIGLTKSVAEMGIVTPIHVMVSESYSDWLDEGHSPSEDYDGYRYSVIDGFRRVYAGLKNGLSGCNAVIWNFKDKELGSRILLPLALTLNLSQKYSWNEIWGLSKVLEATSTVTPNTLDYLFQLDLGDSMKLKDIMLCDYAEVVEDLLSGKKTLAQCYNALQKLRKEEDMLLNSDRTGLSDIEEGKKVVSEADTSGGLSDSEVKSILEMENDSIGELSDNDFHELAEGMDEVQKVGDRHPINEALRDEVIRRDEYCCAICGLGRGLPWSMAKNILHVHHLVPVHCGGPDSVDNLITLDQSCHTMVHVVERNDGRLGMSKEEFDGASEDTKDRLKNIMRVAKYAVEANRRKGRSQKEIDKDANYSSRYVMPGTLGKVNSSVKKPDKKTD